MPTGSFRHGWLASRLADALFRTGNRAEAERVAERTLGYATDADLVVDLDRLAVVALATSIRLAGEGELGWLYPDCERGAMPPLGPLYRQTVYADEALADDDEIVFNAGTHGDAIRMRYEDFAAIAHPIVGRFARRPQLSA